ncbi:MAG: hypothetical protein ACI9LM_001520 [Alteromonadaceae bacterium]|jgi:hypothetical protein
MKIKLIKELTINDECIPTDEIFEAQKIKPRSSTIELTTQQGNVVRIFHYEYTEV